MDEDFSDDEGGPEVTSKYAPDAYEWQKSRIRKGRDAFFNAQVELFGPGAGSYFLKLPSPVEKTGYVFENGEPVLKQVPSVLNDPAIEALRDEAFLSFEETGIPGVFNIGVAFLKYVAAVLRLNYELSDADLTFLISGTGWQSAMVRYMLGGEGAVAKLLGAGDGIAREAAMASPTPRLQPRPPTSCPPPTRPVAQRGWLRRLLSR